MQVHGLYCVLALLVSSLAYKVVVEKGIEISLQQLYTLMRTLKVQAHNRAHGLAFFDLSNGKMVANVGILDFSFF